MPLTGRGRLGVRHNDVAGSLAATPTTEPLYRSSRPIRHAGGEEDCSARYIEGASLTVTASSARPIASMSAARVRALALLSSAFILANASSMGLRSGE